MLIPAFRFFLNKPVLEGLVAVGKYDGKHPCLTCATTGGKIFIHNPHRTDDSSEIRSLNINQAISAIAAGVLNTTSKKTSLLVGTQTNLLAYDVEENADVFYKEVPDGVQSMTIGSFGTSVPTMCIVGGNCSLQGFDLQGNEVFWTVTGDNVSSLTLCDVNNDGSQELVVGSEDYEIRVFQNEEVISEISETDKVSKLSNLYSSKFGYALANGTIGVYDNTTRVWRSKTKYRVTSIEGFDLDADGVPELVSGWSSGKFEVRSDRTGEVVYKDSFPSSVASIVRADYRLDGSEEVICVSVDGEVRGYLQAAHGTQGGLMNQNIEEEILLELTQKRQDLMQELKTYEDNLNRTKEGEDAGSVPIATKINCKLEAPETGLELVVETNNQSSIRSVVVFAEQVFQEESLIVHPKNPLSEVKIPIYPTKHVPSELLVKVIVGNKSSPSYHVFEVIQKLPKFASFLRYQGKIEEPDSYVTFTIPERVNRVIMWANQSFILDRPLDNQLEETLYYPKEKKVLKIFMKGDGRIEIRTNDIELAGDLIQDLCEYLQIEELESVAHFPAELQRFEESLNRVNDLNAVRVKLTAEMADNSNFVKALVIKAEDSRILGEYSHMKKIYKSLYDLNQDLIGEYTKRSNNFDALLESLKEVNQMIQRSARLRVGNVKQRIIASARAAIKANNIPSLFQILKSGNNE